MTHLSPLAASGLITMSMGMVFFKALGAAAYEELGIVEPAEIQCEFEDQSIYDPRTGVRVLAQQNTTKTTVTLNMTLKMFTNRARALAVAGALGFENQGTVTAGTFTVTDVEVGGIYHVGKLNISNTSANDGLTAPTSYTLGTHYQIDAEAGMVRIIAKPGGAGANFVLTYDAAQIQTSEKRLRVGIGNAPDLRGALIFRGTNQIGVRSFIKLHDVQFRPSGGRSLVTEEYTQIEIQGLAFIDTTQASGEEIGYEQTLT